MMWSKLKTLLRQAKARVALGVRSRIGLSQAVADTVSWYRAQHEGADARSLCEAQIAAFEALP
jgi:CDP-glucose 4,6-dehydratase